MKNEHDMRTLQNQSTAMPSYEYTLHPSWYRNYAKRFFDILISTIALLLLSPLFGILTVLIKRNSPGPALYYGPRMGKGGKIFQILKFRTMYETPESYQGSRITARDDDRITGLGKWLRDTKLNELPQLWNVLVGEMSLVGPRPEDPSIAASWPEDVRAEVLSVRPGITSPASIAYHDEEQIISPDNLMGDYMEKILPDKLRLDRLYVRHHTFMTDLDAIFWTLIVLIPRVSVIPRSEGWLFGGPFTRMSRLYLNWTFTDFVTAVIGASVVGLLWRIFSPLHIGWNWAPLVAIFLAVEFGIINYVLGVRRVEWSRAVAEDVFLLFFSSLIVAGISILVDVYVSAVNLPDGYVLIVSMVTLIGFILTRYRLHVITGFAQRWVNARNQGYGVGERVLVAGAGAGGEMIVWLLRRPEFQRLFHIVGYVDDDPAKQGMRFDGCSVFGTIADIPKLIKEQDIGVLFFTITRISPEDRDKVYFTCRQAGVRFIQLSDVLKRIEEQITSDVTDE